MMRPRFSLATMMIAVAFIACLLGMAALWIELQRERARAEENLREAIRARQMEAEQAAQNAAEARRAVEEEVRYLEGTFKRPEDLEAKRAQ